MAFVYWIRKKEHTDIFTQGYVGITAKTVESRYKRHRENANCNNPIDNILYKAMLKYGSDNLVVSAVVECSYEYASDLEKKLRPTRYIGWNIAIGGANPSRLGSKTSDVTKVKQRLAKLGRKLPDSHRESLRRAAMDKNPWDRSGASNDTWRNADLYYLAWLSCKSHQAVARKFNLTLGTLNSVFGNFDRGYNPFLDEDWKNEFSFDRKSEDVIAILKGVELYVPIGLVTQYLDYYSLEGSA